MSQPELHIMPGQPAAYTFEGQANLLAPYSIHAALISDYRKLAAISEGAGVTRTVGGFMLSFTALQTTLVDGAGGCKLCIQLRQPGQQPIQASCNLFIVNNLMPATPTS